MPIPDRPDMPAGYGIERSNNGLLEWSYVTERMERARNYWVSTTRPNGHPHAMPVWGLWLEGAFYFSSDPASRKARNLERNPEAVVHLESGDEVVVLEGTIERVQDDPALQRFAAAYEPKYGFTVDVDNPAYGVYRMQARVAFAWRERDYPQSSTRWRLG